MTWNINFLRRHLRKTNIRFRNLRVRIKYYVVRSRLVHLKNVEYIRFYRRFRGIPNSEVWWKKRTSSSETNYFKVYSLQKKKNLNDSEVQALAGKEDFNLELYTWGVVLEKTLRSGICWRGKTDQKFLSRSKFEFNRKEDLILSVSSSEVQRRRRRIRTLWEAMRFGRISGLTFEEKRGDLKNWSKATRLSITQYNCGSKCYYSICNFAYIVWLSYYYRIK